MSRAAASVRSTPEPLLRRAPKRDAVPAGAADAARGRSDLALVPRRRGAVGLFVVIATLLFGVLLAVTVFQTRLAERQLSLDRVERQVAASRDHYDQLRQVRAQLRSPERLAAEAMQLGMVLGSATEFVEVPAEIRALVAASSGGLDARTARSSSSSLEDFRTVKETLGVAP